MRTSKQYSTWEKFQATALLALLLLVATPLSAAAQSTTGNIQGVVTDTNGAVVKGATVKVINSDTGATKEAITNDEGFYRVTNLIPGRNYKIEVNAQGFSPSTREGVVILLGTENDANLLVSAAGVTEQVEVTTGEELIQTTQSQLSQSFSPKQLTELPILGGSIDNLALLTPGVATPGDADFTNGVGISANGNRGRSNNFQIDGQDNNDNSVAGPSLTLTNTEAIGEYQIITNSFSAEFGRNSGAQVNVITKPGTNEYHGSLFWFHDNSALDSLSNADEVAPVAYQFLVDNGYEEFTGLANRNKNPYRNNRYGGSIGGPIKKDKVFFFATYEGNRLRGESATNNFTSAGVTFDRASAELAAQLGFPGAQQILTNPTVGGGPTFAEGVGTFLIAPPLLDTDGDGRADAFAFPDTPGNLSPSVFVEVGGRIVPLYTGEGVRIFKADNTRDQVIARGDIFFTQNDTVTVRYIIDDDENPIATGRALAGALFDVPSRNNNVGVAYTRYLSPRFVNEARFNFSRLSVEFGDPEGTLPGPGIQFSGTRDLQGNLSLTFGTANNLPQSRKVDVWQEQDTVSATIGNHAMKFGFDFRQQRVENFFLPNFLGTYTFRGGSGAGSVNDQGFFTAAGNPRTGNATAFENLLLGRPQTIAFALGEPRQDTTQDDYFFFFQNDWRVRPNLTLNLGVRYEISTTPFNPIIERSNAREADPSTAIFDDQWDLAFRTVAPIPLDKNNWAPRVGFAWSPELNFLGERFTGGRTVIRGGFGVSYDPSFFNIVLNTYTAAPFAGVGTILQVPGAPGSVNFPFLPSTREELATTPSTNGGDPRLFNRTEVDPNFHNPYTMSYNFGIQQEIFKDHVLEVRYVGSRIVGQFQTVNANPRISFLNVAGAYFGDPGMFTDGILPQPYGGVAPPSAANNFQNRPGTNGNGRVDPNFGNIRRRINGASATYNGLQVRYDARFKDSLIINANYTWSKTIDNASEIFSTGGGGQTVAHSQNPFDITGGERGLSAFHQKHIFTGSGIYDLPWYREQNGFVGHLLGGYRLSTTVRMGSGRPYTPNNFYAMYDPAWETGFIGLGGLRTFDGNSAAPNGTIAFGSAAAGILFGDDVPEGQFVVYDTLSPSSTGTVMTAAQALQAARLFYNDFGMFTQFGVPLASLEGFNLFGSPYGSTGRNTFFGNNNYNVNIGIFKTTNITENVKIEFRAEAFNVLNHRNFGVPDVITEDAFNGLVVSSFQNPGYNVGSARSWHLGFRLLF
jgi:outer membrane receptor protein involved in Fe transport